MDVGGSFGISQIFVYQTQQKICGCDPIFAIESPARTCNGQNIRWATPIPEAQNQLSRQTAEAVEFAPHRERRKQVAVEIVH
jgi:hypothetical protein